MFQIKAKVLGKRTCFEKNSEESEMKGLYTIVSKESQIEKALEEWY
jgi:hypothetical protein